MKLHKDPQEGQHQAGTGSPPCLLSRSRVLDWGYKLDHLAPTRDRNNGLIAVLSHMCHMTSQSQKHSPWAQQAGQCCSQFLFKKRTQEIQTIVYMGKIKASYSLLILIPLQSLALPDKGATALTSALLLVLLTSEDKRRNLKIQIFNQTVELFESHAASSFRTRIKAEQFPNYSLSSTCTCRLVLRLVFHCRSLCNRRPVGWSGW